MFGGNRSRLLWNWWHRLVISAFCLSGGALAAEVVAETGAEGGERGLTKGPLDPPAVVEIVLNDSSPTAAPEAEFGVLFSEVVTGVDVGDFELEGHNLVGEGIISVTGSGVAYDVLVDTGEGAGVIEVHLRDNDTIVDLDSNPLGGPGVGNGDHECDETLLVDRKGPVITLSVDNPLGIECGGGPFTNPSAMAFDTTFGDVTADIQVSGTADPDTVGDYEITYSVSDTLGNATELILVVQVVDMTIPGVVLTGDNPLDWPCGVPYVDPGAAVTDLCDDAPGLVIDSTEVNHDQAGAYTVYLTATDASGNQNQVSRTVNVSGPCGEGEGEGEGEVEGEPCADSWHAADQTHNNLIELTELLRVIQFFNTGGYHCAVDPSSTEDGYVPAAGANMSCCAHDSDYSPSGPDWQILLTELLRVIQFFNAGGYHYCPGDGTEDGFCPGPP